MKKISLFLLGIALALSACDKVREAKQDALTNAVEKAIESKTGTQIDLPDADKMSKNAGFVSYKSGDKVYLKGDEKMQATLSFNKEKNKEKISIYLQLASESGESFMVTLSEVPENFSLPLKGKFTRSNAYDGINPTAVAMCMRLNDKGVENTPMPYEGELTITKLSKDNVQFELNAKGGDITDADSPSNWKVITGSGKITNPVILSYGIDKNNVLK